MDYYLKFKDETEANEILKNYTGDIDVIGVMYHPAKVDTFVFYYDGNRSVQSSTIAHVPELIAIEGWHVNVRGKVCPELESYALQLDTPKRVWY